MKITSIQQQRRNKERVSVYLDDEFWTGMSQRLWEELALSTGQELSETEKQEIEGQIVEDSALSYAFDRLSARMLSEGQLREKLEGRDLSPGVVDGVLGRCRELGLLDDRYWAETIAGERRERGQGRRRVAEILRRAGIDDDMAREVLDEAFLPEREDREADAVLEGRWGDDRLDPAEQRRAYAMLLRRGFSSSAAKGAVEKRAMDPEEEAQCYGWEEALVLLRRRWRDGDIDKNKAYAFLARRSFSPGAIREALARF